MTSDPAEHEPSQAQAEGPSQGTATATPPPPSTPPPAPPVPPARPRRLSLGLAALFTAVALVVGGCVGFIIGHVTAPSGTSHFVPGTHRYGGPDGGGRGYFPRGPGN